MTQQIARKDRTTTLHKQQIDGKRRWHRPLMCCSINVRANWTMQTDCITLYSVRKAHTWLHSVCTSYSFLRVAQYAPPLGFYSMPKCVVLSFLLHFMQLPTGWQCSIPASYGSVLLANDWETTGVIRPTNIQLQKTCRDNLVRAKKTLRRP